MKIAQGKTQDGIQVGNHFDKYQSKNPVVNYLMSGFYSALDELVTLAQPSSIHEIGCGEGILSARLVRKGYTVRACDFSEEVIMLAKENAALSNLDIDFSVKSIYDLTLEDSADLIMCCEVLEHLENPQQALERLKLVTKNKLILSVPREPIWRLMNMARGKYWSDFGNTPGHLQAWSKSSFIDMVEQHFNIEVVKSPLPWTMLLCAKK